MATVIVPSAFIVIEPAVTVGAVPGVSVALVPNTTGTPPLVVSLAITDGVLPPVAGMAGGVSFTAKIVAATTTMALAVLQVGVGVVAGIVQMVYGTV